MVTEGPLYCSSPSKNLRVLSYCIPNPTKIRSFLTRRPEPRPMDPPEPPSTVRRRQSQPGRNYDESLLNELIDDLLGLPLSASRRRTLAEREKEKETETEALIDALLGFPLAAGVIADPEKQNDYIAVRNHILARWRTNVVPLLNHQARDPRVLLQRLRPPHLRRL